MQYEIIEDDFGKSIKVVEDGITRIVPVDPANRHYQQLVEEHNGAFLTDINE
tara:strand:- start:303 stop:458 length:156 start_codon:yes stop_codon:yes gene_type:complete